MELDDGARRIDGGRVLVGGTPFRLLRLSEAGARLLDRWAAGAQLDASAGERSLARRLVEGSLAHPLPNGEGAPTAAEVSVVIPVRDDTDRLAATIAALGDVREVIVVDDESRDRAAVAAVASGATVLRHAVARGPAAARNTGWRAATGALVLFVDADVSLERGALDRMLAHLADQSVAAVAPRVRSVAGDAPAWLAAYEATQSSLDLGPRPGQVRPGGRVPYVPTAALLVRRSVLDEVGGLEESMLHGEDVDLVWRVAQQGWAVRYDPTVTATHPSRPDLRAWLLQRYRYGSSAAALAARHGDAVAPLGISSWSAAAWGAVLLGQPIVGAAVAAGTTAALLPKLSGLEQPAAEAVRIAGVGNLWAGRSVAEALRRTWWPLTALLAWRVPRTRPAIVAVAVVPALLEWREDRPRLGLGRFAALRLLDDLAYGAGVWAGCWRQRSARALGPRFSGRVDPPMAAGAPAAAKGT
jgi:mycofactocin system glycosyltransferase